MSMAVKLAVDQVVHDLRTRPADFRCSKYELEDRKACIGYRVANGILSAAVIRPYDLKFGPWHGWRFLRAVNKWKAADLIRRSRENK